MSGRACLDAGDELGIVVGRMLAVHGVKDAVGAGLKRQMQIGHELRLVAVERDQIVVHVAWMARGVAEPLDLGDVGEPLKQPAQATSRRRQGQAHDRRSHSARAE